MSRLVYGPAHDVVLLIVAYAQKPRLSVTIHINRRVAGCLTHGMCLYQVMMTLPFLNDVDNDAISTQKSKITSYSLI